MPNDDRMPDSHGCGELSQRHILQADTAMEKGDHFQAAEKAWVAVAHALKSIAAQRDWNHKTHFQLQEAAWQLFVEFDRTDLYPLFAAADKLRRNFYEPCGMDRDQVEFRIGAVKKLLAELEAMRNSPPRPFVPQDHAQEQRLDRLTR